MDAVRLSEDDAHAIIRCSIVYVDWATLAHVAQTSKHSSLIVQAAKRARLRWIIDNFFPGVFCPLSDAALSEMNVLWWVQKCCRLAGELCRQPSLKEDRELYPDDSETERELWENAPLVLDLNEILEKLPKYLGPTVPEKPLVELNAVCGSVQWCYGDLIPASEINPEDLLYAGPMMYILYLMYTYQVGQDWEKGWAYWTRRIHGIAAKLGYNFDSDANRTFLFKAELREDLFRKFSMLGHFCDVLRMDPNKKPSALGSGYYGLCLGGRERQKLQSPRIPRDWDFASASEFIDVLGRISNDWLDHPQSPFFQAFQRFAPKIELDKVGDSAKRNLFHISVETLKFVGVKLIGWNALRVSNVAKFKNWVSLGWRPRTKDGCEDDKKLEYFEFNVGKAKLCAGMGICFHQSFNKQSSFMKKDTRLAIYSHLGGTICKNHALECCYQLVVSASDLWRGKDFVDLIATLLYKSGGLDPANARAVEFVKMCGTTRGIIFGELEKRKIIDRKKWEQTYVENDFFFPELGLKRMKRAGYEITRGKKRKRK